MSGVTLDAGGLIALDRNDRRVLVLLARARQTSAEVTVPTTALAQVIRSPAKQARLSRFIRQPTTRLAALDGPDATRVGVVLARTRTSDITDAHVVVCARRARQAVVTSDPGDIRRLDPTIPLLVV
ncbi:MAG TPA: hypothetical protein VF765_11100 [Polyangiaceae bacterium]